MILDQQRSELNSNHFDACQQARRLDPGQLLPRTEVQTQYSSIQQPKVSNMNEMDMLREDRRRLAEDLKLVVRDTESILRHKVSEAGQGYTEARDRLERTLHDAKDQLAGLESKAWDRANSAARETDSYVRGHPWESIGVGVGFGLLVGLVLGRK